LRWRDHLTKARLEIDERLQILARKPLLRELCGDDMQALGAERELVIALGIVAMVCLSAFSAAPMRSTDGERVCMLQFQLGGADRFSKGGLPHLAKTG
jgi:hypothetical protein